MDCAKPSRCRSTDLVARTCSYDDEQDEGEHTAGGSVRCITRYHLSDWISTLTSGNLDHLTEKLELCSRESFGCGGCDALKIIFGPRSVVSVKGGNLAGGGGLDEGPSA